MNKQSNKKRGPVASRKRATQPLIIVEKAPAFATSPAINIPGVMSKNQKRKLRRRNRMNTQGSSNSLALPRFAKDEFRPRIKEKAPNPYCMVLIHPKSSMCRVPDSFARCTALVRSIQCFDIQCNFNGGVDNGRYAALFQPIIGDEAFINHAQNLIVSAAGAWPADFSVAAAYVNSIQGISPFVDQFFDALVLPPIGIVTYTGAGSTGEFGPNPILVPTLSYQLPITETNAVPNVDAFTLPIGSYTVTIACRYADPGVNGPQTFTVTPFGPAQVLTIETVVGDTLAGKFLSQTEVLLVIITGNNGGFEVFNNTGNPGDVANTITIATAYTPAADVPLTGGAIKTMRPVAMSVLCTNTLSALQDGGQVAIALAPGNSLDNEWLVNYVPTDGKFLGNWENLSKLPDAYDGPHKTGAYAWWSPAATDDLDFYNVSVCNDHDYPNIVLAGYVPTPTGVAGPLTVARVEVVRVYEFETLSLLYESMREGGAQNIIDLVNNCLNKEGHCMANGAHLAFIRRMAKTIADAFSRGLSFYGENKGWINPAMSAIGGLMAAI